MSYSYLICGQIKSRIESDSLELYFQHLRSELPGAEIVVSTWHGEFDPELSFLVDRVVLNPDPGPSYFGTNWKRILVATQSGLQACSKEIVVRSRIEVVIQQNGNFHHNIQKAIPDITENTIIYPLGLSKYLINKGLMLGLPDFMQIARLEFMEEYWNTDYNLQLNQDFAMTTNWEKSLSSDQAILGFFLSRKFSLKPFRSRFKFHLRNWKVFSNYVEDSCLFFDENIWGTNFGRLKRESASKVFKITEYQPGISFAKSYFFSGTLFYFCMRRTHLKRIAVRLYLNAKHIIKYLTAR